MAEKRISELTAKGSNLQSTDLLEVSVDAGGGSYVTRYITGSQITGAVSSANFANTNLTFTANRTHDADGYSLTISDIDILTFTANAFLLKNITGNNNLFKLTSPAAFGSNYIQFGRNNIDNNCGQIYSSDVSISMQYNTGNVIASIFAGGYCIGGNGSSIDSSAILELKSTTKGFLLPRMTATEASAVTGVNGLVLYVTSTNGTFTSVGFWGYENGSWVKL
jgi:hypothetical protein